MHKSVNRWRKTSIVLSIGLVSFFAQSQDPGDPTDGDEYTVKSVEELVKVPNSPEAAAFTQYGNMEANLYHGKPKISIPLHTVQGREMSLPFSLDYDAGGIKVDQIASYVGLGWNLNVGGVVTREVHGLPDDILGGKSFTPYYDYTFYDSLVKYNFSEGNAGQYPPGNLDDYFDFIETLRDEGVDVQPDSYSFNVNGLRGKIYINYDNNTAYCMDRPELDVEVTLLTGGITKNILSWKITDTMGNQYIFGMPEVTHVQYTFQSDTRRVYNSAWHLTQIISGSGKDTYTFEFNKVPYTSTTYIPSEFWTQEQAAMSYKYEQEVLLVPEGASCGVSQTVNNSSPIYSIRQVAIDRVLLNGVEVVDFKRSSQEREDLDNGTRQLDELSFYDPGGSDSLAKHFIFEYDYFGPSGTTDEKKLRLKLDALVEKPVGGEAPASDLRHDFTYYTGNLDDRGTFAADHWGFMDTGIEIASLQKITYPTGGTSEFVYKTNEIWNANPGNQVTTISYGSSSLAGGEIPNVDDDFDIDSCEPEFTTGGMAPAGSTHVFSINETSAVTVKMRLSLSGIVSQDPNLYVAALYYKPPPFVEQTLCQLQSGNPEYFRQLTANAVIEESLTLAPGDYAIALINSDSDATITMSVKRDVTVPIPARYESVGGLRLHKIIDDPIDSDPINRYFYYNDVDQLSTISETEINNAGAHGTLHEKLIFTNYQTFEVPLADQNTGNGYLKGDCHNEMTYYTNLYKVFGPHITYPVVSEISFDALGNFNGYKVTEFKDNCDYGSLDAPFRLCPENGMVIAERSYNDNKELLMEVTNDYSTELVPGNEINTVYYTSTGSRMISAQIFTDTNNNNKEYYTILDNPACQDPDPGATCRRYIGQPEYLKRTFGFSQNFTKKNSTLSVEYDGINTLSQQRNYTYESNSRQVSEVSFTNSEGQTEKVIYQYPHDFGSEYQPLITNHRIGERVGLEREVDANTVFKMKTEYDTINGRYVPSEIKYAPDGGTLESRINYQSYDSKGNVIEVTKDGFGHVYLWGHNYTKLIAYVKNATLSHVLAKISEPGDINDKLDFLQRFNINDLGEDLDLFLELQDLYDIPNAEVQVYIYDQKGMMSAQYDTNKQRTGYEYDGQGRLSKVIDHNGDILVENNYHLIND